MGMARYLVGDVFDTLATLPDDSVDLVMSSPPFLALRSYLPADHPDKASEIGSEPSPGAFLDTLLDVVEALDRVLAPHGSLVFELGDTYAGGGSGLAVYSDARGNPDGMRDSTFSGANTRSGGGPGWPLDKSLCMVPQSFAWALAYGRNPFTGRETPRWRVRNVIAWCRPNPPVGALGDKFRPATSYLTVATKARDRYFDLDAVRTEPSDWSQRYGANAYDAVKVNANRGDGGARTSCANPAGAPPLDYWVIPTEPYAGSHYATFPRQLVVRPVKAMSPERVCMVCGRPSRRIVDSRYLSEPDDSTRDKKRPNDPHISGALDHPPEVGWEREHVTLGWSDCGHDAWRRGVVLDPFAGSGTTLAVAVGHGRDAIGVDLDARNAELAVERVGPLFLTVEHMGEETVA